MKSATNATNDWMDSEPDVYLTEPQFKTLVDSFDAYADERVNEWKIKMDDNLDLLVGERLLEIRADALEEAATMIEKRKGIPEHHSDIAELVRALKDAK